ncbi:P-loop containing nucleoside triphosphate hydrolase protein [Desarmillaria tabescens]|uniref:P-loop containing nucleoside triphosphate hydrolase protein n=1 Tax=Armillaria tabescens TaxID=1929756 RepID=A0AA39NH40_ARMTA|nr:P-loop containing nucleoside triphosphate hydrolase protein [Desarmillaria tabescens]KAK0465528.1 P-loop containing nucleoside triphosphate hydrolase protein [Desarmillaria tabescens]
MASQDDDASGSLDTMLKKTASSTSTDPLLPSELTYLISAFLPSHSTDDRSKAFLVLSAFCQGVRKGYTDKGQQMEAATESLAKVFSPLMLPHLEETTEKDLLIGISFLTALFQVDWQSASSIFQRDDVLELIMDSVDLNPSTELSLHVAHLLSQACGYKPCRTILPPQTTKWLEFMSSPSQNAPVRAAATIALIKLSRGSISDKADVVGGNDTHIHKKDDELAVAMKNLVIYGDDHSSIADAVEGLAYLSVDPVVKEMLSQDSDFLKALFASVPHRKPIHSAETQSSLVYGVILVISSLCAYRPHLTEEQSQMEKLRRMGKANSESNGDSPLNDDGKVEERIRKLMANGVLEVFPAALAASDSQGIRLGIGKALLSIVTEKENRGQVLRAGGAKVLLKIIKFSVSRATSTSQTVALDPAYLESIQALSKLSITASPVQVFGPNDGAIYDIIRPFSLALQHSSTLLLQKFEVLMALTNLSSHSAEVASRMADSDGLLNRVELLLLEDHVLIRRASMELICNLIAGSEKVFERYGGSASGSSGVKTKVQILLALSDVEDIPTRLAASGALATVTTESGACQALLDLQRERHRAVPILAQLIDPSTDPEAVDAESHPGLLHRGVICARNILANVDDSTVINEILQDAGTAGLTKALAPSKKAGKKVTPTPKKGGGTGKVAKADWKEGFKKKQVGVSDMTLLTTISNESINDNLQKRWTNAEIYTYIGAVLISVNPFRDLGIYSEDTLQKYKGKNRLEVPPHVFGIAESAYYNMNAYHENQCVIISGESGAGKTEAAKRIMQYIAAVSGGQDSSIQEIKDMVLATNPLLESFGCAKTLRNNNSSRHGKYLEIMFNAHGEPIGAQITNYLLEKGRVVGQVENERNFHIFYQFTKAATSEQREAFGLQGPEAYAYTSLSNCLEVQDINDAHDYSETIKAMDVIGLDANEQNEIFRMLAIILWLGNVQFEEKDDGNSQIADTGVTDFVAYLMDVDAASVVKVLTSKIVETQRGGRRGSVYDVPLNPTQASSGRDALAKAIYNNLFEWIVSRVNVSMKPRSATSQVIGILDIFGFEIFEDNSFEQLCINYVNEKLQQIFIELTLKTEQEEYVREQIKWTPIKYFNNKIVCDLIEERRPPGIFAALNDACATAHADPAAADNSFVQRTSMLSSNPHFEARGAQFLVRHYAGDVMYNVSGMTDKNKDSLIKDLLDLVASSTNQFLQTLFPDRPDPNSKKRPPTAGDRIKASAGALVDNLMKAKPSYIRTIKPNQNRSSSEYDVKAILHQIKYLGLQENIRVRRAGFAYRNTFEKMVERFYLLSPNTSYAGEYTWQGDSKSGCEQILKDTGIAKDEWQMGVTKAFIKNPETLFALETMRDKYWHNMAARIQRAFRNYMRYKHECARRIQRFWKNNKEALVYAQVRDYGHQILGGRKERRRFSLLSYRRFMGDYLDINGRSALGAEIANSCNIGNDDVTFSGKIHILVSKFGRSSKLSPRFIVVTQKAVHIVILQSKEGHVQHILERKIPLVTIKSIAMSNLRDDWMCLNVNASEEGDPVFSCYFKTELAANLMQLTHDSVTLNIGPTIDYAKKKEQRAQITVVRDETIKRDDVYKSHTVRVPSGEPAGSLSRPPAKRKAGVVRPITQGKLLKAGGPSKPSGNRSKPTARALPGKVGIPAVSPISAAASTPTPKPKPKPAPASVAPSNGSRPPPAPPRNVAPPPPPPPPPAVPSVPMYRAKFAFEGQEGEMSLKKDGLVELVEKDDNGWWLVKKDGVEGWAPYNYLELEPPKAAPAPPPPPRARAPPSTPVAKQAPVPTAKVPLHSVTANASAKPVSVFPGMAASNGSATPWKKQASTSASTPDDSPGNSRPSSALAGRAPPPVAAKPKPPVVASKPAPKIPGKPPIPVASRPNVGAPPPVRSGGVSKAPAGLGGQMDLAAALAKRAQRMTED